MRTFANLISAVVVCLVLGGPVSPAYAQGPWSALPGSCASTDNNFYNGTPSNDYPVARFRVPGGSIAFNGFHDGYIAVICSVDNPRNSGTVFSRWDQLQVTYRDPDGMGLPGQKGSEYQAYVELVRASILKQHAVVQSRIEQIFRSTFRDPEGFIYVAIVAMWMKLPAAALASLARALDQGFACFPHLDREPVFEPLRGEVEFTRLLAETERRHRAAIDAFTAAAGPAIL
jgi:hypothetical protein